MMSTFQIWFPMILLLYTSTISILIIVNSVDGGSSSYYYRTKAATTTAKALPGLKCIPRYPPGKKACDDGNCNFDDPNHVFKFACDTDCIGQHGAAFGHCLESNICTCGPLVVFNGETSFHCLNTSMSVLFQTVCEEDCHCTHHSLGGRCNFRTKACECGPLNPKPKLNCPYKTSNEYFKHLLKLYASIGINVAERLSS